MAITLDLPVWRRETYALMRGVRLPMLIFIAVALALTVALVILMPYWDVFTEGLHLDVISQYDMQTVSLGEISMLLAMWVMLPEALLVACVMPGLSGAAFARERESGTFEALLLTPLSARAIVLQKWLGPVGAVAMLLVCVLPVVIMSVLLGGVSPADLLWAQGHILAMACCLAAMGVYASTLFRRANIAILIAYLAGGFWALLQPLLFTLNEAWSIDASMLSFISLCLLTAPLFAIGSFYLIMLLLRLVWKGQRSKAFYILLFVALIAFFLTFNYLLATVTSDVEYFLDNHQDLALLGNPLGSILHQLDPDAGSFSWWNGVTDWLAPYYTPAGVLLQLLGTLLFLWLATRRVTRLRQPQA